MMIRFYLLLFISVLLCISNLNMTVAANENGEPSFINSYEEDITGDGLREYFKLQGTLLSNKSNYYRDVWLNISSPFAKQWKISFNGGYDPSIQLIDLNQDNVFDLFYQIAKDEKKQQYDYQLYSLKNGDIHQIPLPEHHYIQGEFLRDFKISLQMNPKSKPIMIDVANKKNKYMKENIYDEDGKLIEKKRIIIHPISHLEPILISESKGYGLKSSQPISGLNDNDLLGRVETLWYFKNDKWIILTSDWVE